MPDSFPDFPDFPLTFVVGTGRSGSSALSRALRLHPRVLSVNELLASLVEPERALPDGPMTGAEFWPFLAEPSPVFDMMVRNGVPLPEFLDPRPGVPALNLMVLPHLTEEPDALLAELGREVPGWPARPAAAHLAAVLDRLRERLGRQAVVERSGYSVGWIPRLREVYPAARFVHLHRSGPDCALSMSRHPGYRVIALVREILERAGAGSLAELTEEQVGALPQELADFLAGRFGPSLIWDRPVPLARFGALWSELVTEASQHLAAVPPERRATLSYEALIEDPDAELARLATFAGVDPDRTWLSSARPLFDPARRGTSRTLPPEDLAALRAACEPGEAALAAARP